MSIYSVLRTLHEYIYICDVYLALMKADEALSGNTMFMYFISYKRNCMFNRCRLIFRVGKVCVNAIWFAMGTRKQQEI